LRSDHRRSSLTSTNQSILKLDPGRRPLSGPVLGKQQTGGKKEGGKCWVTNSMRGIQKTKRMLIQISKIYRRKVKTNAGLRTLPGTESQNTLRKRGRLSRTSMLGIIKKQK